MLRRLLPSARFAVLSLAALPACGTGFGSQRPNVLLVVIDTLRADHVGASGYGLPTTPELDALTERGTYFEQAIASSSWTRPSMAALLTGHHPESVGLTCHNFRIPEADCDVLPRSAITLAEHLGPAGWETAGVVANINVDPVFGFHQGFDRYVSIAELLAGSEGEDWRQNDTWLDRTTRRTTDEALAWLDEREGREPFFLYLHYLDPHAPHDPPQEHAQAFSSADYDADADTAALLARYDAEIQYVDRQLARVLERLEDEGELEHTIIIVTSDHGEEFGDHGGREHGWTLYEEQLRVPLTIAIPELESPPRIEEQVCLIDVVPTICEVLELRPPADLPGRSLLPLLRGARQAVPSALSGWGYKPLTSFRAPPWKLIHNDATGDTQLFHLEDDPGEKVDVSEQHPDIVAVLRVQLEQTRRKAVDLRASFPPDSATPELSESQRDALGAIGYTED